MKITNKLIVDMLIQAPFNEKEVGFNSALIKLLKHAYTPGEARMPEEVQILKVAGYADASSLRVEDVKEVVSYAKSGQKLYAVKKLKELTGLDLRSAKDIIDNIRN